MHISISEIAEITGGKVMVSGDFSHRFVSGISWDSRTVTPGALYVAFEGERADGHTYCGHAFRAGAHCALVQKSIGLDSIDTARISGASVIRVPDTLEAMRTLAAAWRRRLSGKVIAITGSSGKTTTKNLVREVLSCAMSVSATQENQNNEIGVPATLLRADENTAAVVVEMGMQRLHELEDLCSFVRPDYALVTNVGTSHIEFLGSRDNIARAKAEALAAVSPTGCVFVNASDPYAKKLIEYSRVREQGAQVMFYDGSGSDPLDYDPSDICPTVFAADITMDEQGFPSFVLCMPAGRVKVTLGLRGLHNVHNAVAAAAVASVFDMQPQLIAQALGKACPAAGRQNVISVADDITVIDDAYNANPDSMAASLAMFAKLAVFGRRIAVLGDMGELGDFSAEAHCLVGKAAAEVHPDQLICVGKRAQGIAQGALEAGLDSSAIQTVPDAQAALDLLSGNLGAGDCVLVKASHAMRLDLVVKGLTTSC